MLCLELRGLRDFVMPIFVKMVDLMVDETVQVIGLERFLIRKIVDLFKFFKHLALAVCH